MWFQVNILLLEFSEIRVIFKKDLKKLLEDRSLEIKILKDMVSSAKTMVRVKE